MKKILILLVSFAFTISSCEKDEKYDWDNYTPVVQGLTGPSVGYASGLGALNYKVTPRGGATYEWSVDGIDAVIDSYNGQFGSGAEITFGQSDVDVDVLVKVVETTAQGVSSEATYPVSLKKFKPRTIDEFVGTWATDDEGTPYTVEVVQSGDTELTFTAHEEGGEMYSSFYTPTYMSWGEPIVSGHGNDGDVIVNLDLNTGAVTIEYQKMGLTTWGTYWYEATGVWDGFDMKIMLDLNWYYAEGDSDEAAGSMGGPFAKELIKVSN